MESAISGDKILSAIGLLGEVIKSRDTNSKIDILDMNYVIEKKSYCYDVLLNLILEIDSQELLDEVIIRFYNSPTDYDSEKALYDQLQQLTSKLESIDPIEIIVEDREDCYRIYDVPDGESIWNLDELLADFTFGVLLSIIHGTSVSNLSTKQFQQTLELIFDNIPMDEFNKNELSQLVESKITQTPICHGGYYPATRVDPNMWKMSKMDDFDPDMFSIVRGEGYHISIPLEPVEYNLSDRMGDIAEVLALPALIEYVENGNLDKTEQRIESIIAGYSQFLYEHESVRLTDLYPQGLTLDLHILTKLWLDFATSVDRDNIDKDRLRNLVSLSKYLLEEGSLDKLLITEF